jgi:hypothetical protein
VSDLVDVAESPGEKDVGVAEGVPPVQAERDTEASTAAQPKAVNLALSVVPAMVVRMLRGPPHACGR